MGLYDAQAREVEDLYSQLRALDGLLADSVWLRVDAAVRDPSGVGGTGLHRLVADLRSGLRAAKAAA
jgi:hypothetical protein